MKKSSFAARSRLYPSEQCVGQARSFRYRPVLHPAFQKEIQQQAAEDKTPGNTEIMLVNASLLSVDTVGDEQIAQVYFNVLLREDPSQEAPIDVREIWHFVRPASGDGTWKLDGIQQVENV